MPAATAPYDARPMHSETLDYSDGTTTMEAYLAFDRSRQGPRPVVVICHAWAGQDDFARSRAEHMASLGYLGFALDVYGKGRRGNSPQENAALMEPFVKDRGMLLSRLRAAVHTARHHDRADLHRVAVMGYCFGGLCALDVARAGLEGVVGAVSFHGLFAPSPLPPGPRPMRTRVLALHGWNDPMVRPDAVLGLAKELTDAGCDWTLEAYGHRGHAFTNQAANDPQGGMRYCPRAERRANAAAEEFLREIFADAQPEVGAVRAP